MNYVPWDTTALSKMADYVKAAIGQTTNVGIGIMAIITAVLVVIKIIKKFTH